MKTTLISPAELAALPTSDVLIVDCRKDLADPGRGPRDYAAGHIPGAVFAELDTDLSDLSLSAQGLGRHPLPTAAALSARLAQWGWHPGLQVVAYDQSTGAMAAARLWWLLRHAGQYAVAVLDGGLDAWLAEGRGVDTAVPQRAPGDARLRFAVSDVILDHAQLLAPAHPLVLDARAAARWRGEVEPLDRVGGHVPGALNRPFGANLGADGRFKDAATLKAEFLALIGTHAPGDVVHMCGSGVTACHNLLAMEHAGLAGSRLYAPSWSGWSSDPAHPVAKGAEP